SPGGPPAPDAPPEPFGGAGAWPGRAAGTGGAPNRTPAPPAALHAPEVSPPGGASAPPASPRAARLLTAPLSPGRPTEPPGDGGRGMRTGWPSWQQGTTDNELGQVPPDASAAPNRRAASLSRCRPPRRAGRRPC